MTQEAPTRQRRLLSALALLAVSLAAVAASASDLPHVVVIGEVQGSAATVTKLLTHLGLTDAEGHWAGADAVLVQTGDPRHGGLRPHGDGPIGRERAPHPRPLR